MIPFRHVLIPAALFLFLGCSGAEGDAGRLEVFETTGKITLSGKPIQDAVVTFAPTGQYPAAVGRTDADGEYTLTTYEAGDGAAAGDYAVLVAKPTVIETEPASLDAAHQAASSGTPTQNPATAHAQAARNAPKSEVPERYGVAEQSGLTATVKDGGENVFNFDLTP